jgi:PBSX family phage terminase large subunit
MDIDIKKTAYSSNFRDFLISEKRYQILFGSRGSGKTHQIVLKLLIESFKSNYNHILYINKEFRHIRTQQFAEFKKVAKQYKLYDYFTFYEGDYRIVNNLTGTKFTPVGMDDAEKTKGISDPTIIWWDEVTKGKEEDFLTLNALLRTPLNPIHQFIISFNPVSEKHWIRSYFFDEFDAYKLNDNFKDSAYLNHSTFKDNDFIDKEAYEATLTQNAYGNVNRMLVDIKGMWGVETNTNPFFYSYSHDKHFRNEYEISKDDYLDISFDFNKEPCTAVIGQYNHSKATLCKFDVILGTPKTIANKSPLEAVCYLINQKYIESGMFAPIRLRVTGDPAGKQGGADLRDLHSFYTTIKRELGINTAQCYIRNGHTTHVFSGEMSNKVYRDLGYGQFTITHPMIENDINLAYSDEKESLNKAKAEHGLHILDAVRYLDDFWFCHRNGKFTSDMRLIAPYIENLKKEYDRKSV